MNLRVETADDHDAVLELLRVAFNADNVIALVEAIRAAGDAVPELELVAEDEGEVVGCVMFSHVGFESTEDDGSHRLLALTPLAVHPSRRRQGIGGALVRLGLRMAAERGERAVIVEGLPRYYPQFGFEIASSHGIEKPDERIPDAAFMVANLTPDRPYPRGKVVYPDYYYEVGAVGPSEASDSCAHSHSDVT